MKGKSPRRRIGVGRRVWRIYIRFTYHDIIKVHGPRAGKALTKTSPVIMFLNPGLVFEQILYGTTLSAFNCCAKPSIVEDITSSISFFTATDVVPLHVIPSDLAKHTRWGRSRLMGVTDDKTKANGFVRRSQRQYPRMQRVLWKAQCRLEIP